MKDILIHYGVPGMKWGVRKQYEGTGRSGGGGWGPNTVAGGGGPSPLAASMAGNPKKKKSVGRSEVEKMGIKDFTIKKGSEAYRIAGANETVDGKRKYMTINEEDRNEYKENMDILPIDGTNGVGEYTYEFSKDALVKNGESVINDLIGKYGDKSIEEAFAIEREMRSKFDTKEEVQKYLDDDFYGWDEAESGDWTKFDAWSRDESAWNKTRDFVWDMMATHGDEIINNYKKQGYDAIVDPMDYVSNIADVPIIVLDPKSSVKKRRYEKIL